jgi:hypothetical protein
VYATDSAPPVDAEGNQVPWEVGPGSVVQTGPEGNFTRVSGVSSVAPYQDHMKYGDEQAQQGLGVPDIAVGSVDVAVAESGIARVMKLGPLMAKNAEKELEILAVHEQFFYDLVHMWLPAYEGTPTFFDSKGEQTIEVVGTVDDPMPVDRKAEIDELAQIFGLGVMPVDKLYKKLNELGYEFEDGDFEQAIADITLIAEAQAGGGSMGASGDPNAQTDQFGNPVDQQPQTDQNGQPMDVPAALSTKQLASLMMSNGNGNGN